MSTQTKPISFLCSLKKWEARGKHHVLYVAVNWNYPKALPVAQCVCSLGWNQTTGRARSFWPRGRNTGRLQNHSLSNSLTHMHGHRHTHTACAPWGQRDKGWQEEGMYPSLPVSDNMGLHPALHDWIQITISILCPLSCPPNYIPNIPQNLNVVA